MSQVETARGAVDSAELGVTLMHEHVFVLTPDVQQNYPAEWGSEDDRVADAVQKLQKAYDAGVRTIVDPTVVGLGRYVPRIERIAQQVPLNIVVATGLYTYDDVPFFFHHRGPALDAVVGSPVPDPMVDMFVGDITDGIAGTGVKAGMLKCAIDKQGLQPGVERVLRAVGKAHVATGAPVMVHTHPRSRTGLEVMRVLGEEQVDPSRVLLAHSGDSTDADHLQSLADEGFLLGMDRMGINLEMPFEERVGIVVELCERGYAGSMVLAQDASCYIDWIQPDLLSLMPDWHYLHVQKDVVPALLERGVTQEQVDTMLVGNPRRFFER